MSLKQFEVISKLGEGAYSSVYKVKRKKDQTQYALKKVKLNNLSEREQENALNQVRILASIHNPHIIGYKQAFIESNCLCIIMEYANDGDLYQKIVQKKKTNTTFSEDEIWRVLIQVTKGLKALHNLKILHRDLKSANVFLTQEGVAKLGDMNVSKIAKNGLLYTQTGTPYYASPEVWKDQPYDQKSDIWSLGCVIYQMTSLKPPFRAEDMEGLYNKVIRGNYSKILPVFSHELSTVIKSMLQVNPHQRPTSDQLLQFSVMVKKSRDLNIYNEESEDSRVSELLKTIRMPKGNLHYLTDRLPKANYRRELEHLEGGSFNKSPTSPDRPTHESNLPMLKQINVNTRASNPRKLTHNYRGQHRQRIEPRVYIPVSSIQVNRLHHAQSYKNPVLLHKPRNISLPPIKG